MTVARPGPSSRKVRKGERLSARDTNLSRDGMRVLQEARNALLQLRPRPWSEMQVYEIVSIQGDYLQCVRIYNRSGVINKGTVDVFIAKPARLRQSETSRNGVTYVYTDSQTRTASKSGEDNEVQRVTPDYLVGDWIEATTQRGITGIAEVDEQRGAPIDSNVDGRAWAAEPPP